MRAVSANDGNALASPSHQDGVRPTPAPHWNTCAGQRSPD